MFLSSPYSSRLFLIFSIFPLSRDISGHQCLAVWLGEASSINKTKPKTRTQLFNDHILLAEKQSGSISKLNGMERKDFWKRCHHVCHGGIFSGVLRLLFCPAVTPAFLHYRATWLTPELHQMWICSGTAIQRHLALHTGSVLSEGEQLIKEFTQDYVI